MTVDTRSVRAIHRNATISAQKARLVADQIRGLPAEAAVNLLRFSNKRAAAILFKVLESAIANAEHNMGLDIEELKVAVVDIGEARSDFRTKARARGRANRITKRNSHILVTVQES